MKENGKKFDGEKARMELIPHELEEGVAKVMGHGAAKYGDHNWRGGLKYTRLLGAAKRHIKAFSMGEDLDPESGLSHIAHAACCLGMLLGMISQRPDLDDRYKRDALESIVKSDSQKAIDELLKPIVVAELNKWAPDNGGGYKLERKGTCPCKKRDPLDKIW